VSQTSPQSVDLEFLELLASKICHDLISPIGAISNGIEFMEDMGAQVDDDVIDLLRFSSTQASAKLQAFRMAYGAGGGDVSVKPEEVHKCFGKFIELDKKITQNWDPHGDLGFAEPREGFSKMLMCLLLLSCECLPKGGKISILSAGGANKTLVKAEGEDAALKPPMDQALSHQIAKHNLEPRYVHAYTTGLMAKKYGYKIEYVKPLQGGVVEFILSAV
jgi:histidine phosphotransferase ChpT